MKKYSDALCLYTHQLGMKLNLSYNMKRMRTDREEKLFSLYSYRRPSFLVAVD